MKKGVYEIFKLLNISYKVNMDNSFKKVVKAAAKFMTLKVENEKFKNNKNSFNYNDMLINDISYKTCIC